MKRIEEIKQNKYIQIVQEGRDGFGGIIYDKKTRTKLNFILSWGAGWEHCSVSITDRYKRCPSWEQMCFIKDSFWNDDECCVEYHPAKKDYVNNHEYCLHIWKPIDQEIPTPPSLMVGLKKDYSPEEMTNLISMIRNGELPRW
ncbi:MAG TPA: hypothetical protein IAB58_01220 [Candidatus Pelethosoma merdigallinarum]|nr:hypothetical protein [Candidatus Pelethosoma merdigallinarum]